MKYFALLLLSAALAVSCAATEPEPAPVEEPEPQASALVPEGTRDSPFMGHGVIQEIGDGEIVIEHETIPGFMAAMTMAFPVAEEAMSAELEVGDEIMFDIEMLGDSYQVFRIEEMEEPAAEQ